MGLLGSGQSKSLGDKCEIKKKDGKLIAGTQHLLAVSPTHVYFTPGPRTVGIRIFEKKTKKLVETSLIWRPDVAPAQPPKLPTFALPEIKMPDIQFPAPYKVPDIR